MQKFLLRGIVIVLTITMLFATAGIKMAYADDGVSPQPTEAPIVIGKGDYVVHSEPAQKKEGFDILAVLATSYRSAWTDAYYIQWFTYSPIIRLHVNHRGSHNSESDLNENKIWADGKLLVNGIVINNCSSHTAGYYAGCTTSQEFYKYYAHKVKTTSYFNKTGYVPTTLYTSDTGTPP